MKFSTIVAALSVLSRGTNAELLRRRTTTTTAVCSAVQIAEFDCDIADDVVGIYVCRGGDTTCVDPSDTLGGDKCGCCPGDNRVECLDDGDDPWMGTVEAKNVTTTNTTSLSMMNATDVTLSAAEGTMTAATGVCSAFQIMEFDCDIRDDVVGVYVCRAGMTTCSLTRDLLATDNCGCCAGDNRLECLDDGDVDDMGVDDDATMNEGGMDTPVAEGTMTAATGVCSAFQIMEFDCDIRDDVVGVYVCRAGITTCSLTRDLLANDKCGCCAGDSRLECQDDGDVDDMGVDDDGMYADDDDDAASAVGRAGNPDNYRN